MRVILIAGEYRPELVDRYLEQCSTEGWPARGGVMCFEPNEDEIPVPQSTTDPQSGTTALATSAQPTSAPPTSAQPTSSARPRLVMSKFMANDGSFAYVRLVKEMAVVLSRNPSAIILDSTTGYTRYSDFDRHGIRAAEIPALTAKTLYWMAEPPIVVHFIPATMKPYYVREWGQLVEYAPVETLYVSGQDVAAIRIDPIWQRALAKRTIFTPKERLKRFLRRAIVARIAKLIPRFSFFR